MRPLSPSLSPLLSLLSPLFSLSPFLQLTSMDWRVRPNITSVDGFWMLWETDQHAFAALGQLQGAARSGGACLFPFNRSMSALPRPRRPCLSSCPSRAELTYRPRPHSRCVRAARVGHCYDHG